jgi:hypothetical protein
MISELYSVMQSTVPLWLLLVVTAIAVSGIIAAGSLAFRARGKGEPSITLPTTADVLGVRWRWQYRNGDIRDITPFCPRCDGQVSPIEETRHGYIHLISFRCSCSRWQSQSFQCSHEQLMKRVYATVKNQMRNATESLA